MPSKNLQNSIAAWEELLAGAEANRDDIPALEPYRAELEEQLGKVRAVQARRMTLAAEARQATEDVQTAIRQARELADRLRSGVHLLYGSRSPKLAEFGISTPGRRVRSRTVCQVKGCPLEAVATAK